MISPLSNASSPASVGSKVCSARTRVTPEPIGCPLAAVAVEAAVVEAVVEATVVEAAREVVVGSGDGGDAARRGDGVRAGTYPDEYWGAANAPPPALPPAAPEPDPPEPEVPASEYAFHWARPPLSLMLFSRASWSSASSFRRASSSTAGGGGSEGVSNL